MPQDLTSLTGDEVRHETFEPEAQAATECDTLEATMVSLRAAYLYAGVCIRVTSNLGCIRLPCAVRSGRISRA